MTPKLFNFRDLLKSENIGQEKKLRKGEYFDN